MKHVLSRTLQLCLFACLLTGTRTLANAQDSSAPPAADNTKANERDKNKAETTADQQKENLPDNHSTDSPFYCAG
jgi:hypothetical protein